MPGATPSRDANGRALPAKFRFYQPDTTIPATVYVDQAMVVPHAFPILSDAAGRWPQIFAEETLIFSVGWTDQTFDQVIRTFTGVRPTEDASTAIAEAAQASADDAAASAEEAAETLLQVEAIASDLSGEPFRATSSSNLTIGTGLKALTLNQTGKLFSPGQTVVIARTSSPNSQMVGAVQTHDSETGAMTVDVATSNGAGTFADWTISQGSSGGVLSVGGLTGIVSQDQLNNIMDDEIVAMAIAL